MQLENGTWAILFNGHSQLQHRLQLSQNLRDSPGFLEFVPGPGTLRKLSRAVSPYLEGCSQVSAAALFTV